ncbi:hypothetical protein EB796_008970 [Bugula neritina]|uniref:Secreted protein n=1 Tax=Bugula neritina TaxID=10212 RepID=A0A7J7K250_BUGNE|nr:hypothetical protein EB796_008970 [Bugula neritina]
MILLNSFNRILKLLALPETVCGKIIVIRCRLPVTTLLLVYDAPGIQPVTLSLIAKKLSKFKNKQKTCISMHLPNFTCPTDCTCFRQQVLQCFSAAHTHQLLP